MTVRNRAPFNSLSDRDHRLVLKLGPAVARAHVPSHIAVFYDFTHR